MTTKKTTKKVTKKKAPAKAKKAPVKTGAKGVMAKYKGQTVTVLGESTSGKTIIMYDGDAKEVDKKELK